MTAFPFTLRSRDTGGFPPLTTGRAGALFLDERGAATAEYAIATMATVAVFSHIRTIENPLWITLGRASANAQ